MLCKHCNVNESVQYSKYTSGEFCSKKCARAFSTKEKREEINQKVSNALIKRPRVGRPKGSKTKLRSERLRQCKGCGASHLISDSRNKSNFCSRSCYNEYCRKNPDEVMRRNLKTKLTSMRRRRERWAGLPFEQTSGIYRREVIFEEQNGKCLHCGLSEWMGKPISLELDHIDGNRKNNRRENLRLLCPNCHAQTPTYKGKNCNRELPPVLDEHLIEALISQNGSIHRALVALNLCPGAGNWQRAKRLLLELKPQVSV